MDFIVKELCLFLLIFFFSRYHHPITTATTLIIFWAVLQIPMSILTDNFTELPTVMLLLFSAILQLAHKLSLQATCPSCIKFLCINWMPSEKICLWPFYFRIIGYGITLFWEGLCCKTWKWQGNIYNDSSHRAAISKAEPYHTLYIQIFWIMKTLW